MDKLLEDFDPIFYLISTIIRPTIDIIAKVPTIRMVNSNKHTSKEVTIIVHKNSN